MNNLLLIMITFTPLVGALLTLLPWGKWFSLDKAREERLIKLGATAISTLPLGLAIMLMFATFGRVDDAPRIPRRAVTPLPPTASWRTRITASLSGREGRPASERSSTRGAPVRFREQVAGSGARAL